MNGGNIPQIAQGDKARFHAFPQHARWLMAQPFGFIVSSGGRDREKWALPILLDAKFRGP
jgi:hypothetical protein